MFSVKMCNNNLLIVSIAKMYKLVLQKTVKVFTFQKHTLLTTLIICWLKTSTVHLFPLMDLIVHLFILTIVSLINLTFPFSHALNLDPHHHHQPETKYKLFNRYKNMIKKMMLKFHITAPS